MNVSGGQLGYSISTKQTYSDQITKTYQGLNIAADGKLQCQWRKLCNVTARLIFLQVYLGIPVEHLSNLQCDTWYFLKIRKVNGYFHLQIPPWRSWLIDNHLSIVNWAIATVAQIVSITSPPIIHVSERRKKALLITVITTILKFYHYSFLNAPHPVFCLPKTRIFFLKVFKCHILVWQKRRWGRSLASFESLVDELRSCQSPPPSPPLALPGSNSCILQMRSTMHEISQEQG